MPVVKCKNLRRMPAIALMLAGTALPVPIMAQESTYDSGIAAATATATSKRDFNGVWVTRFFEPRFSDDVPLTPEARTIQQQYTPANDPGAKCLPAGWPRILATPYPVEFIQTPAMTLMFFEGGGYMRRIWTDGREHPADADPTWYGHSIGWWEDDTFVVDTVGANDLNFLSSSGEPKTEALRTVERWTLLDGNRRLRVEITFDDPNVFTQSWSSTRVFDKTADQIMEYFCENNRNDPDDPEGFNYDGVSPYEPYKGLPGSNIEQ